MASGLLRRAFWGSSAQRFLTVAKLFLLVGLLSLEFFVSSWYAVVGLPGLLVTLVLYYIVVTFAFNFGQSLLMSYYLRRHNFSLEYRDSFTIVLRWVSSLVAHLMFFVLVLYVSGVNISDFVTAFSLFAVAVVILIAEHWNKFFNGFLVLFNKDFKADDFIRVGDLEGRIRDIGFLRVELITRAGDVVYVPNNVILNKETINYSKKRTRAVESRLHVRARSSQEIEECVLLLREQLFSSFSDVDQKSFFYTVKQVSLDEVLLVFEFRIQTPSWRREREITRFLALRAVDLSS